MNSTTGKSVKRHFVVLDTLVALAAVMVAPLRAQSDASSFSAEEFVINGFQANSSAPFQVKGTLIGNGVWERKAGPFLGGTLALIPGAAPTFGGLGCRTEYSEDQIVAQDGSTIAVHVSGNRCEPYSSPGDHVTNATYIFAGGTGRFKDVAGGTGTVSIDAHADGSTSLHIGGFLRRQCGGGVCGS